MTKVFINGNFVEEEHAKISVFDHGFLYGDGIYETLRAYSGSIFHLEDHLNRLFESAGGKISLSMPWDRRTLDKILRQCLKINRYDDAVLRLSISRGEGPLGLDPDLCPAPTLVVLTRHFRSYPQEMYKKGIAITLVKTRKNLPEALDPSIKSMNFLNNIMAKIEAKNQGTDEGILLNHDGHLTEGTVSNLFFVKDSILCTPSQSTGILMGISRKVVLKLAEENKLIVKEGRFPPEDLDSASEIFLTNTTYEVMPVSRIQQREIPIGPVTQKLQRAFRQYVINKYEA